MGQVISMGVTGSKAKFTVDLPKHTLSFNTKVRLFRSHERKVFILQCFLLIYIGVFLIVLIKVNCTVNQFHYEIALAIENHKISI